MKPDLSAVSVRSVAKSYEEGGSLRQVLKGVDLDLRVGELVVLLGRSGAGKSTLLNMIGGLDTPDSGDVIFSETHLTRLTERERTLFRRQHIGFVFQSFNLIPTLTVLENVMLPLELSGRGGEGREVAVEHLKHVGLDDRADSFPDRLSGGEQQRVAIARALANSPLLVLADEPTGNLDFRTGGQVMRLFADLVREQGTTMLVVTHDAEFLDESDRILAMRDGTVREVSDLDEALGR
ncbi:MAG: ABC transporter ATP-binding protein [Rhodothermales bacterium]|nr:ABC transporter ATP-binding protein [Rhodothermales bacterium]